MKFNRTIIAVCLVLISGVSFGQAFSGKGSKSFQLGIGLTEHHVWYPENGKGPKGQFSPLAGVLNLEMEFGVHKYVGVGFHLGAEFTSDLYAGGNIGLLGLYTSSNYWSIGVPVGVFGNFHFYQLIAEKTGASMAADKLDIYAGVSLGSGVSFAIPKANTSNLRSDVGFTVFGGPYLGIRYNPAAKIGAYLEAGFGKTYVSAGMTINM